MYTPALRMLFIVYTESTLALPNIFPPGAFPEYRLNCTQLSNGTWHCSPVEQQCDSFVELGVVCKNYEGVLSTFKEQNTIYTVASYRMHPQQ